jgi:hypothetical protein
MELTERRVTTRSKPWAPGAEIPVAETWWAVSGQLLKMDYGICPLLSSATLQRSFRDHRQQLESEQTRKGLEHGPVNLQRASRCRPPAYRTLRMIRLGLIESWRTSSSRSGSPTARTGPQRSHQPCVEFYCRVRKALTTWQEAEAAGFWDDAIRGASCLRVTIDRNVLQ